MSRIVPCLFLLLLLKTAWAIVPVPTLTHRVTDLTATLTAAQTAALEQKLAAFETKHGSQIAVLLIPTVQEEDIAQFGIRVADAWKVGRQKIDDGVILIIAKNDRKMRLEVGYGLEGIIPDAVAKRVIAETVAPHFKRGDFAGGIDAGVSQIMQLIKGESLPPPGQKAGHANNDRAFLFILLGGVLAGFVLSSALGRFMGAFIAGIGSVYVAFIFLSLSLAVFLGFLVFILVMGGINRGYRSGWYSGGSGGSSWGGGFGGGGGSWSGGGGGFGGGGASGSW
ncbi:MAG: TPM domain-containing protein [Gammaproteobacteria bacterium]